ncbi:hypothetical protein LU604_19820 [Erwinia tracheiphila]|uniref:hypothetical protein n=1 Tax=Erwinia tracheiphila TaxID=65700 RepID=UPI001F2DA0D3|nr:hypothetical protein [Erwinia tracheiphila]UIA82703.1 hypothetical protein LU604_19820 [Erwinia tracheiphila]UIA91286.1 hypothetical protein LU632_19330 [Erwinia tracheiphila]
MEKRQRRIFFPAFADLSTPALSRYWGLGSSGTQKTVNRFNILIIIAKMTGIVYSFLYVSPSFRVVLTARSDPISRWFHTVRAGTEAWLLPLNIDAIVRNSSGERRSH